jgi:hypothetical protein
MPHAWVACFLDLPPPPPVLSLARYVAALLRMHHGAIVYIPIESTAVLARVSNSHSNSQLLLSASSMHQLNLPPSSMEPAIPSPAVLTTC